MPAFGVVDALQSSTIEMRRPPRALHRQRTPSSPLAAPCLSASPPDGCLDGPRQGRKLMDAFHANYNIKSRSAGNTSTQMGGWYRKEIKTVADLKGLKFRMVVACSAKPKAGCGAAKHACG